MDETRRILKTFGVAVTDFEAEAAELQEVAAQLSGESSQAEIVTLLKNVTELCSELSARWQEVSTCVSTLQGRLLSRCAEAASRLQSAK